MADIKRGTRVQTEFKEALFKNLLDNGLHWQKEY